jgi:hypothetical protein
MKSYCDDVRNGHFPQEEQCYRMIQGEEKKFFQLMNSDK